MNRDRGPQKLTLVSGPAVQPLTLAEAKSHLRVGHTDEDALIGIFLAASTAAAEKSTGRAFIDQTWDYYLDFFPHGYRHYPVHHRHHVHNWIEIPKPPLIDIEGVFYTDTAGVEHQFTGFSIDVARAPARIFPTANGCWPSTLINEPNAVRIRFRAGYVDPGNSPFTNNVPADIKAAILLMLGTLYQQRETIVIGATPLLLPWGAEQLLYRHTVQLGIA